MAADTAGPLALSDLPEQALVQIIRQLDAHQLAALLLQDRRLRQLAGDGGLWAVHAKQRWPGCSAGHYGGDWRRLFARRAALPRELVRAADRVHNLTQRASAGGPMRLNSAALSGAPPGGSPIPPSPAPAAAAAATSGAGAAAAGGAAGAHRPAGSQGSPSRVNVYGFAAAPHCNMAGMLFEEVMQGVFTIGVAAAASGAARAPEAAAEVARYTADIAWWLAHKPEVVVRFVRRTADSLREYDMWGSGFSAWPDVPWRRSALQFVLDLGLGPDTGVCLSVLDRLAREAATLDAAIQGLRGEACHLDVRQPEGMPRSHWWYYMGAACA